ncbi:MAG: hypothetical protein ABUS57_05575 [Pseudomonadota bacterium]
MLLKIAYDLIAIAETPVAAGIGWLFYAEALRSPHSDKHWRTRAIVRCRTFG